MSTNNTQIINHLNDNTFVLEPLVYEPTEGPKTGKFIDMRWDCELKKNGTQTKDMVLVVELEEKDELGQTVKVEQPFNMLPNGRGLSAFKKQMQSFFGKPLTKVQLAGLKKEIVVGKPVIVNYRKNHLGRVGFDSYLPANTRESVTA